MNREWLQRRKTRLAAVTTVAAVAVSTVAVLALNTDGYATTQVDLTTQSVWVTNDTDLLVGRVNRQINELDSSVLVAGEFDVLQEADTVLVTDNLQREIRPLNVAAVTLGSKISLAEKGDALLGGGTLAISDATSGAIWAGTPGSLSGLDPAVTPAVLQTAANPALAVSQSGTVYAVAPGESGLWSVAIGPDGTPSGWQPDDSGELVAPEPSPLPGGALSEVITPDPANLSSPKLSPVAITTVGQIPVVLDRGRQKVVVGEYAVDIPDGDTAQLQQPGPAAESVLVATSVALYRIALADGGLELVSNGVSGNPAQPVNLAGCVHAAWAGDTPSYLFACGQDAPIIAPLAESVGSPTLIFRVNRSVIVLNDQLSGNIYLMTPDGLTLINNWQAVKELEDKAEDEPDDGEQSESDEISADPTDCAGKAPEKPVTVKDSLGARTGRSTVLAVLDNDTLSDCSTSVITSVESLDPAIGSLAIVNNGRSLQLTLNEGVSESQIGFSYTVSDAISDPVAGQVAINVFDSEEAVTPKSLRKSIVQVEVGGSVTYNVLDDWFSPSGDDLYLANATVLAGSGDEVTFLPNGAVTFNDKGVAPVKKEVTVLVTDGLSNPVPAKLVIDVQAAGTTKLKASPAYLKTVVDEPASIDLLRSVISPAVEEVRLKKVTLSKPSSTAGEDIIIQPNIADGTLQVSASKAGIYYFTYDVAAGQATSTGYLRVDVEARPTEPTPPVAATDVVFLPEGGVVRLDPTVNDIDPMGSGLAIQRLDRSKATGLTVASADMHLLTISATGSLPDGGATLPYAVSNGYGVSAGQIRVVGVPAGNVPPPTAEQINVTVRAGDATTIPIAEHAADPNGDQLTLLVDGSKLTEDQGVLFGTATSIRYLAPATPPAKPVKFSYTVLNSANKKATASVEIAVTVADPEVNSPPRTPATILARTYVSSGVTVSLPLNGIDPDGDWVMLSQVDRAGLTVGSVLSTGTDSLSYKAFAVPGVDTLNYRAADPLPWQEEVNGRAKVIVIDRPETVDPPSVPELSVVTRPGRAIGIDVLTAVDDTSGTVDFVADSLVAPDGWQVRIQEGLLVVEAPAGATVGAIKYQVINARKLIGTGVVTVEVLADAPIAPPTAADVFVSRNDFDAATSSATVSAADKISNPGGVPSGLVLELDPLAAGQASVTGDRAITVPVTDQRQVLAYQVFDPTDPEKQVAKAFLVVPPEAELAVPEEAIEEQPMEKEPVLVTDVAPLVVNAGETVTAAIADHVTLKDGVLPTLVDGITMTATAGSVGRVDAGQFSYSAPADGVLNAAISATISGGEESDPVPVSIEVTIIPKEVPALQLSGTSLEVEAGSSTTADLSGLVSTLLPDPVFTFEAGSPGAGFEASLSGSQLTVSADTSTAEGTSTSLTISATDGPDREIATATITVVVNASSEPLMRVSDVQIQNAQPGKASTVDVLAGVTYNPFGSIPTLVSVGEATGGAASVSMSAAGQVTVTPSTDFKAGSLTVPFTLADETGSPSRQVTATILVTVRDRPAAPGTPTVVAGSVGSHTLTLQWTDNADNGLPITKYEATGNGAAFPCPATPCTINDLTNGESYSFTVKAWNELGWSDESAPSPAAVPNAVPDRPSPPVAEYIDQSTDTLRVKWTAPTVDGTEITGYTVSISDGQAPQSVGADQTTIDWAGLTQGVEYSFSVIATNEAGDSSDSGFGPGDVPSRRPDPPTVDPLTFSESDYNNGNRLTVTWTAPANNGGKDISGYNVLVKANGAVQQTLDAGLNTSASFDTSVGVSYTAEVIAKNSRGNSEPQPDGGGGAVPYNPPARTEVTATPSGYNEVTLNWVGATSQGRDISYYRIDESGSQVTTVPAQADGAPQDTVLQGVTVGQRSYTVSACYEGVDFNQCGAPGTPQPANVYTRVGQPTGEAGSPTADGVSFTWNAPGDNGRGPVRAQWSEDGSNWNDGDSHTIARGCGQPVTLYIRGIDAAGDTSDTKPLYGNAIGCPQPSAVTGRNASGQPTLTVANFSGGRFEVRCWNTARPEDRKWTAPSNYLGAVAGVSVPQNGTVVVNCPSLPASGTPFQLEIFTAMWATPITW